MTRMTPSALPAAGHLPCGVPACPRPSGRVRLWRVGLWYECMPVHYTLACYGVSMCCPLTVATSIGVDVHSHSLYAPMRVTYPIGFPVPCQGGCRVLGIDRTSATPLPPPYPGSVQDRVASSNHPFFISSSSFFSQSKWVKVRVQSIYQILFCRL